MARGVLIMLAARRGHRLGWLAGVDIAAVRISMES
jgi:hypothetical protein